MTLQEYINYFKNKDGLWVEDISPCCFCYEVEFNRCRDNNIECKEFEKYVNQRVYKK